MMVLGLRTVIYHVADLKRAKEWYGSAFGVQPYFDEPFYVGFNIGGYELGLDPDNKGVKPGAGGSVAYCDHRRSVWKSGGSHREPALLGGVVRTRLGVLDLPSLR